MALTPISSVYLDAFAHFMLVNKICDPKFHSFICQSLITRSLNATLRKNFNLFCVFLTLSHCG